MEGVEGERGSHNEGEEERRAQPIYDTRGRGEVGGSCIGNSGEG